MKKTQTKKEKLIKEITQVIEPKLFNWEHGTMNKMERQIMFEALGYLNIINFSVLPLEEIKKSWDITNLKFQ